jgi:hypothetical protein
MGLDEVAILARVVGGDEPAGFLFGAARCFLRRFRF